MARKPTGNPTGRPKADINWEQFESLCGFHCTQHEIASFFKIHPDTLRDHVKDNYGDDFSIIYKKYLENGKCSLRRFQFTLAKKNATMAIWLGKQYLDQKDKDWEEIERRRSTPPNDTILSDLLGEIKTLKDKVNAT
jgi:hypothetical protein